MTGTRWTTVVLLTILILSAVVFAQPKGRDMGGGGIGGIMMLADKLDLTDDQIEQIENLRYDMQKRNIDLKANLEKARLELGKLMREDKKDRKKILAQVEVVNGIEGDLNIARVEGMLDVNDILTETQRKTLEEERRKIGGMHDEGCRGMDEHRKIGGMHDHPKFPPK